MEQRKEHGTNFLGWGAGRHVCVGKKTALMMMKMVSVAVLGAFEFVVEREEDGREIREVPKGRGDMLFKVGRASEGLRVRYRARR